MKYALRVLAGVNHLPHYEPARSLRKKWSRELSAVLCECERSNVGDVYSPWGDVTPVTEGNEAARPELAQKGGRGSFLLFCASEGTRTHTHEGTRS